MEEKSDMMWGREVGVWYVGGGGSTVWCKLSCKRRKGGKWGFRGELVTGPASRQAG